MATCFGPAASSPSAVSAIVDIFKLTFVIAVEVLAPFNIADIVALWETIEVFAEEAFGKRIPEVLNDVFRDGLRDRSRWEFSAMTGLEEKGVRAECHLAGAINIQWRVAIAWPWYCRANKGSSIKQRVVIVTKAIGVVLDQRDAAVPK